MKDILWEDANLDLDLMKDVVRSIQEMNDKNEVPNAALIEAVQLETDKIAAGLPAEMTEDEINKMMSILSSGKPIINEYILTEINRLTNLPGITTIHYRMVGHDRRPFRGKMICYALRSADGDECTLPKRLRRKNEPIKYIRPLTERRNLFSLSDNFAKGPMDQRWKDLVTRFSTAYTIINQITQNLQQDKILKPEDATEQRISTLLHGKRNSETE